MVKTARNGQVALEYALALTALMVVVVVLGYLVSAARDSARRSEALVSTDIP